MLNVAIAVDSPVDFGPRAVGVIAAACEEVIGERRCPVASDLAAGDVTAWFALVHPSDAALTSVRIDFRDRTAEGVLIEQRSFAFSAGDSQESRLASVGSVIAALAAAREGALTPSPAKRSLPQSATVQSTAPEPAPSAWSLDLAALFAPAVDDGPHRLGALAGAGVGLSKHAFGLVSGRYAAFSGNPRFSWWTLSAGLGARTGDRSARFALELDGEVVFEHTTIAATRGAERDTAGENAWGGRLGANAVWALSPRYSVVLGADGTLVLPRINVVVADQSPEQISLVSLGLHLGLRFRP